MDGGGSLDDDDDAASDASDSSAHDPQIELRCVLAVIRHGDRTPKQKMKVTVTQVIEGGEGSF